MVVKRGSSGGTVVVMMDILEVVHGHGGNIGGENSDNRVVKRGELRRIVHYTNVYTHAT